VVPTGLRPLARHELLQTATPGRMVVEGMDTRLPDAVGGWTGPYPLGFVFLPLLLPVLPFVLVFRRLGWLPWTVEARAYPWGRRYPPVVFAYAVRGGTHVRGVIEEVAAALERGDGRPEPARGESLGGDRGDLPPLHSFRKV
jgi:hypothetical protein